LISSKKQEKEPEQIPEEVPEESPPLPPAFDRPLSILGMVKTMNIHGGVRRYFELGNAFVDRGHSYSVTAVQSKEKTPWMEFKGRAALHTEWLDGEFDIGFTGAHECFNDLVNLRAKKKVIFVVAKFYANLYLDLWKKHGNSFKWIGVAKDWNKGMEQIDGVCIPGGVNTNFFTPSFPEEREHLTVAFYARTGKGRGVEKIIKLAGKMPDVRFIGFDSPNYDVTSTKGLSNVVIEKTATQTKMRDVLHRADVVVSAMDSAGWNNVVAEGMACGCVPIATEAGTGDLILPAKTGFICPLKGFSVHAAECLDLLKKNHALKGRMARRASCWVRQYDWGIVAEKILAEVMK